MPDKIEFIDGPSIPTLEILAQNFCVKNNLPQPERTIKEETNLVLDFGKIGLVLLSKSYSSEGSLHSPVFRLGGSDKYSSHTIYYSLMGNLNGESVSLDARASTTYNFKQKLVKPEFATEGTECPVFVPDYPIHRSFERVDKSRTYWFLTEPRPSFIK